MTTHQDQTIDRLTRELRARFAELQLATRASGRSIVLEAYGYDPAEGLWHSRRYRINPDGLLTDHTILKATRPTYQPERTDA